MTDRSKDGVRYLLMALAMIAALAIILVSFSHYRILSQELKNTENELSESMENWHRIAEEKEALQADLKVLREELREKQQTLQESVERAEELKKENDSLREEISGLKQITDSGD